ncbi:T9SS type A sorting domain-containing protein [Rubrivirga sp. IMCC43871]|uniref:T9SS type A sorting domain-containing protein n=1 Tax=Rubrivirga sp. IMCC43871 TaxID=3391575 RepID=UPI00398FFC29
MRLSTLAVFAAALALAAPAVAQCTGTAGTDFTEVTIRDINAIPAGNVDLLNAEGASLTIERIQELVSPVLVGERVQFTAVLLTDPFKSGIRSLNAQGIPGGIHTYMRDVAAATDGVEGMGTQVIDFSGSGTLQAFFPGDELIICGEVQVFEGNGGSASQVAVESATATGTVYGPEDPLVQPVVVTTDDLHDTFDVAGEVKSQIDWDQYESYNGQYVRLEAVELIQSISSNDRVDVLYSSPGQDSQINQYDTSVCFRNDRDSDYFPTAGSAPGCIDEPFTPPATGIVNVQGFLIFQGDDGSFDYAVPDEANYVLSPFEEADFVIAVAPPIVTINTPGLATPAGVDISATVLPGTDGNTVSSVTVAYTTTSGASGTVDLTNTSGDLYEGTITGVAAGDFVTYSITAVDNENNASTPSASVSRLVVDGPISSIFQVQATPDGGVGGSGITTEDPIPFDLGATVQSAFTSTSSSGTVRYYATIQDDASLAAFSGVWIYFDTTDPGLTVGDQITITEARVDENFGVTALEDLTFTTTGTGTPYAYKEVTTDLFSGADGDATAEQHEGILLSFPNASIVATNADDPSGPFGEFLFASGDYATPLRADDFSDGVSYAGGDPAEVFTKGDVFEFIRGPLYYSFGNYKLALTTLEESIGTANAVGTEGIPSGAARLVGAFPNPATGTARVRFELATAADVSLRVFDTTGRQVMTLADGARAAGSHDVSADLSGLASGVYVLRMVADGDVATARLAVVR